MRSLTEPDPIFSQLIPDLQKIVLEYVMFEDLNITDFFIQNTDFMKGVLFLDFEKIEFYLDRVSPREETLQKVYSDFLSQHSSHTDTSIKLIINFDYLMKKVFIKRYTLSWLLHNPQLRNLQSSILPALLTNAGFFTHIFTNERDFRALHNEFPAWQIQLIDRIVSDQSTFDRIFPDKQTLLGNIALYNSAHAHGLVEKFLATDADFTRHIPNDRELISILSKLPAPYQKQILERFLQLDDASFSKILPSSNAVKIFARKFSPSIAARIEARYKPIQTNMRKVRVNNFFHCSVFNTSACALQPQDEKENVPSNS